MDTLCAQTATCQPNAAKDFPKMSKIGIFAGTFDPIHDGHLAFAQSALAAGLDKVYFLAEPRPWRKQGVRSLEHRRKMVVIAISNETKFGDIVFEGARLTPHETLPILQKRFSGQELVLLFGDDVIAHMVEHIADWPHIEDLARSVSLLIAARNHSQVELSARLRTLKKNHGLPFRYKFVEPQLQEVSSSKIRHQIKRGEKPKQLPTEVLDYIQINKLYTSGEIIS